MSDIASVICQSSTYHCTVIATVVWPTLYLVCLSGTRCLTFCVIWTLALAASNTFYITTQCQTPIFCTPLSSTTPTRLQPVAGSKVGRYVSEFQHSLQGIYARTARIIYPVDYVKTYSYYVQRHSAHSELYNDSLLNQLLFMH